ncbi:hypothetical protein C1J03_04795 [Sulfitobacter sp. SK012]|uniref:hypothetical protein n=1 Tax=Sulfitobacter sp. SK012 TaxID=1389005 RepID=UPI000E0C8B80|nr:hypothetical protein [Sulfitobacter sp. SK012]AXI45414.1 hypothetical protein C1J03_04795 [Sulfitobacter sp. SK012]
MVNELENSDEVAQQIYQEMLDRICVAYEMRDFDCFARMINVPHTIFGFGPTTTLNDHSDLREVFDGTCTFLATKAVTDHIRTCLVATFTASDEIDCMHETRMLCGAHVLEHPYPVQSILRRINGEWAVCRSYIALDPNVGMGRILHKTTGHA